MKILAVETNEMVRLQMKGVASGHEVRFCKPGVQQTLAAIRRYCPDVILFDVEESHAEAHALTLQIKRGLVEPSPKIIFLTRRCTAQERAHHLEVGADTVVCKPLRIRDLEAALRSVGRESP